MRFVKKFTPPNFQAKNFAPKVSPNFDSFGDKNINKWVKMEKITPLAKKVTLLPAVTAMTNLTSQTDGKRFFCSLHGPTNQWGMMFGILLGEFLWLSIKVSKRLQLANMFLKKNSKIWKNREGKVGDTRVDVRGKVEWSLGALLEDVGGHLGHQLGHVGAPVDAGLCLASCQTWHSWEAEQPPGCETQFGCWYIHRYSEAGFSLKTVWIGFFL